MSILYRIVHVVYLVCNTVVAQLLAPLSGLANDEVTAAQRVVVLVASQVRDMSYTFLLGLAVVSSVISSDTACAIVLLQKTLPVAIAVIGKLGGTLGEAGILVLPCIALHVIQVSCSKP